MENQIPELRPGFAGQVQPPRYITLEEQSQASRELKAQQDAQPSGTLFGLARENQWLSDAASRYVSRQEDFDVDPDFKVTPEILSEYELEFSQANRDYISKAKSQAELQARATWVREDLKRHRELSAYGVKGVLAELTMGVLDPVGWGAGIMTGFVGTSAKLSRLQSAMRTGAIVGAESAAFEAALTASDTQRGIEDIMFATGAGVLLGSGLGAAFRARLPDVARAADEADSEIANAVTDMLTTPPAPRSFEEVPSMLADEMPTTSFRVRLDTVKANADIQNYVTRLEQEASEGLRGKKKGDLKKEARELTAQADAIRAQQRSHKARVAAFFGAPRNRAEAVRNEARFASIDNMYAPKIQALQSKADEALGRVQASDKAEKAKKELSNLRNLSRVEQLRKVYPDGAPKLREQIEIQKAAAIKAVNEIIPPVKVTTPEVGNDSAGAARVTGSVVERDIFTTGETADAFITRLIDSMDDQPDPVAWKLPKWVPFKDQLQSAFTTLDNSSNLVNRALNRILNENPQGNVLPEDTASILAYHYGNRIRSAVRNRVQEGWDDWANAKGYNLVDHHLDLNNKRREFDMEVFRYIKDPTRPAQPGVAHAADGLRDGFELALKIRKENGEAGFEDIVPDRNYVPVVMDGININSVVARTSKGAVLSALSRGYQTGKRKIPKQYADKIAELQYERAMSTTLSARQSFEKVISRKEEQEFIDALRASGVDETEIEQLLGNIVTRDEAKNMSNRAKLSLGINVEAQVGDVRVLDLISTDIGNISESYFKEAAGGAALARHGFRTEKQALDVIDAAEKYGRNIGLPKERLAEEAEMLRDIIGLIKGRSIEENPNSTVATGLRMGRAFTRIVRLQNLWASSFPEAARSISHLGLKTVLSAIPSVAFFRRKAARVDGKSSGDLTQPEMQELEFLLGYVEEFDWVRPVSIRHEDGAEGGFRRGASAVIEKALNLGSRVSNITSGFQAVQGGMGKATMLSIKRRLADMAQGKAPLDKSLMNEVGWDDSFIDEFLSFSRANPKVVNRNGVDFQLLNVEKMTPAMREKLAIGIERMAARLMQKQFVGESSTWMNKTLGLAMTQFRTFMLVSAEKQLIHDIRGDKIRAAQVLMWSSLLAYMSYSAQVHLQSFGEEDRDTFIRERMEDRAVAFGVFNKLPQTAIVSLAGDVLATLGMLPDDMYAAPGRHGFRPQTAGTVAPVLGTLGDGIQLGASVVDLLTGDAEGREVAERARKLVPLANSVGIGQIMKAGIGEL